MRKLLIVSLLMVFLMILGFARFDLLTPLHFYTLSDDQVEKIKETNLKLFILGALEKANIPKEKIKEIHYELLNTKEKVAKIEEEMYQLVEEMDGLINEGNYDEARSKRAELMEKYKEREQIIRGSLKKVVDILGLKEKIKPFMKGWIGRGLVERAPMFQRSMPPRQFGPGQAVPPRLGGKPQPGYGYPGYLRYPQFPAFRYGKPPVPSMRAPAAKALMARKMIQILEKEILSDEFLNLLGSMAE